MGDASVTVLPPYVAILTLSKGLIKVHCRTLAITSEKGVGTIVTVILLPSRVVRMALMAFAV